MGTIIRNGELKTTEQVLGGRNNFALFGEEKIRVRDRGLGWESARA